MAESHREEIAKLEALYASNPGGRVFVHLAEALRKAGEHERARGILDEGLGRHGDSASGHVVLGRVLLDMQQYDDAERSFNRVLDLDAGNLVALRGLADLAVRTARPTDAVRYYAELLARNPFDDEIRQLLAEAEASAEGGAEPGRGDEAEDGGEPQDALVDAWDLPEAEPEEEEPPPGEWPELDIAPGIAPDPADEAAYSAAPGALEDAVAAEPEFGVIEMDGLPGDLAALAGTPESAAFTGHDAGPTDWDDLGAVEADLSDLYSIPEDPADGALRLEGSLAAETVEFSELDIELEIEREAREADPAQAPSEAPEVEAGVADLPVREEPAAAAETSEETGEASPEEPRSAAELLAAELRNWGQRPETPDADAGLVTETMADLYMSQGFHERAAEVYRAVLERRRDDAALQAKLEAAETARRGGAAGPAEDAEWLRGVGTGWMGSEVSAPAATPYAWTEAETAESDDVPPIRAYLGHLLSWRRTSATTAETAGGWLLGETGLAPEAGRVSEVEPEPAESPAEPEPLPAWAAGSETPWSGATDDAAAAAEDQEWHEDEQAGQPVDPWAEPVAEPAPDTAAAEDPWAAAGEAGAEAETWAATTEPADPWASEEAAAPAHEDPWGGDPWAAPAAPAAEVDPWAEEAPAEAAPTEEPAPPPTDSVGAAFDEWYGEAPAGSGEGAAAAEQAEDEDEDLAMFRAWLQSLKK